MGLSRPVCALHVQTCAHGCTHACRESLRPSGPEQSPASLGPQSCRHLMASTVQLRFFWLCCFGLSKLKHHSSQASHGSRRLCVTPRHTCLSRMGLSLPFGLCYVPEGAEGWSGAKGLPKTDSCWNVGPLMPPAACGACLKYRGCRENVAGRLRKASPRAVCSAVCLEPSEPPASPASADSAP